MAVAIASMATRSGVSKFLWPQPTDIQAAASTAALWLVQPFDWIKKTFFEKSESA